MNDIVEPTARPITMQLAVTITAVVTSEPEVGGYSAEVPSLPGCHTEGDSLEEVRENLRDAIEGWLGSAHESAIRGKLP